MLDNPLITFNMGMLLQRNKRSFLTIRLNFLHLLCQQIENCPR